MVAHPTACEQAEGQHNLPMKEASPHTNVVGRMPSLTGTRRELPSLPRKPVWPGADTGDGFVLPMYQPAKIMALLSSSARGRLLEQRPEELFGRAEPVGQYVGTSSARHTHLRHLRRNREY
jgi:hypothetical protein